LALTGAIFAFLGLGATEARAQNASYLLIDNNTSLTLTLSGVTNWSNQEWGSSCAGYNGNNTCADGTCDCLNLSSTNVWSDGPPQTIAPFTWVNFLSVATGFPTNGTGGTISYTIDGAGSGFSQVPTVAFTWSAPWVVGSPVGLSGFGDFASATAAITWCPFNTGCQVGPAEGDFATGTDVQEYSGGLAGWQLNEVAPKVPASTPFSGYGGSSITINGTNFSTTGLTRVTFGSVPALSVACSSSTRCVAVAPPGAGTVPVTLSVLDKSTLAGQFAYLATPACTYGASNADGDPNVSQPSGWFSVECTPDAAGDPIYIFQRSASGGWTYVFDYPVPNPVLGGAVIGGKDLPDGTTGVFLGCTWNPNDFPQQAWMNSVTPNEFGCDPTATAVSVPICTPESPSQACAGTCGKQVVANGCGGSITCNNTCACVAPLTCQAAHIVCGHLELLNAQGTSCGTALECGTCPSGEECGGDQTACCAGGEQASYGHCCPNGQIWALTRCIKPVELPPPPGGGKLPE
jgi:hypothetical protein